MSGGAYVPLRDIAAASGVSELQLQTRYWPPGWAVPRDFRLLPRTSTTVVSKQSLPQLAEELDAAGRIEAATMLRIWLTQLETPADEEFIARSSAPLPDAKPWFRKGQYK